MRNNSSKMSVLVAVLVTFIGPALVTSIVSCVPVKQFKQLPSASLKGISFGNISFKAATLLFNVDVQNPYAIALPLLDIDYNIVSEQNKLFSGQADLNTTIPAAQSKTIALPVQINYSDLIKVARLGSTIPYQANIGLSFNAPVIGKMRLPLSKTGNLKIPTISQAGNLLWQQRQ